jgi:hypothetical protein
VICKTFDIQVASQLNPIGYIIWAASKFPHKPLQNVYYVGCSSSLQQRGAFPKKVSNCEYCEYLGNTVGAIHHLVPGAEETFAGLTNPITILRSTETTPRTRRRYRGNPRL